MRANTAFSYTRDGSVAAHHRYRLQALIGAAHQADRVSDRGEIGTTFFAETDDRWNALYARLAASLAITPAFELTTVGIARLDELRPDNPLAFRAPPRPSHRTNEIGVFEARLHGALLGMQSELRGSARLHFSQASIRATRSRAFEVVNVDRLSPTYRLAAALAPLHWLSLSASLASGNRLPTFGELFGDRAFLQPNPELDPERSLSADLGLTIEGHVGAVCLSTELRVFDLRIDDAIVYVRSARFDARPENIGFVAIRGAELGNQLAVGEHVRWTTSATALDSRTPLGHAAPNRPNLVLYTRLDLSMRPGLARTRLGVFGDLQVVSFNYTDNANLNAIPGRQFVGFGGTLQLWDERLGLQLRVDNAFDQASEDLSGFALPRRALFASLTMMEDLR